MNSATFPHDVFLSHSAKDQAVVRPLAERLRKDGPEAKAEGRRQKAEILHSPFFLHPSLFAFGSDWAQLLTVSQPSTLNPQPTGAPLNQERRFLPLRLDDAPRERLPGAWPVFPLLDLFDKPHQNSPMNSATISTKGQLVIPQRFRKALHLQAGQKVSFSLEGEKLVLQREQPKRARLIRGKFGRPVLVAPPGSPPMTPDRVKAILNELP